MAAVALTLTDDARASTSCEAPGDDPGQKTHIYTRAEVAMHGTLEKRIWVTYEEGVYDITDFIVSHPGGVGKIMLAAGKAIDPFWRIYQQHTNSKLPKQLLSEMRIGTLDPNEPAVEVDENDPYANEPVRATQCACRYAGTPRDSVAAGVFYNAFCCGLVCDQIRVPSCDGLVGPAPGIDVPQQNTCEFKPFVGMEVAVMFVHASSVQLRKRLRLHRCNAATRNRGQP